MTIEVKLCGNKSEFDLQTSIGSGAHYIGVVFAESKRQTDPRSLARWLKKTPLQPHQKLVGVFVNPSTQEIEDVLQHVNLGVIQLHGDETVAHVLNIKERFQCEIWKAIHHTNASIKLMNVYKGIIDGFVVDAKSKAGWGGTGQRFDWDSVPNYIAEAQTQGVPCFIAGGVTPDNIHDLAALYPHGIDVSSGIETDGQKDVVKIEEILRRSTHVSHLSR